MGPVRLKSRTLKLADALGVPPDMGVLERNERLRGSRVLSAHAPTSPGEWERFCTLSKGPARFAANVITSRDEDGCPEGWEVRWFDTEEEATAAVLESCPNP